MTDDDRTAGSRDRWYCGSSAETVNSRELDRLMENYRQDGARVTRDDGGGFKVRLPDEEPRSYERVPDAHARTGRSPR